MCVFVCVYQICFISEYTIITVPMRLRGLIRRLDFKMAVCFAWKKKTKQKQTADTYQYMATIEKLSI